jgi:hypothetical protein
LDSCPLSRGTGRGNRRRIAKGKSYNLASVAWIAVLSVPDYFPHLMDSTNSTKLKVGQQVRVVQQIAARDHTWTSDVRGIVVDYTQQQTGSWYAHSKDDKLWLDRLTLRKPDGELITLNLDEYSLVEIEPAAA